MLIFINKNADNERFNEEKDIKKNLKKLLDF